MLIIFDSFDCSGKSTLINHYSKKYGTKVLSPVLWSKGHQSTSPQFKDVESHRLWSRSHYEMTTRMLLSGGEIDMIFDRWIFTEKCYSPVMRNYQMDYYWKLDRLLANKQSLLWVYPTLEGDGWKNELKRRFDEKGESFVTFPQLLKIKANFDKLYSKSRINSIKLNTHSGEYYSSVDHLCEQINNRRKDYEISRP